MSPDHREPNQGQPDYAEDEIELIDLLRVLWKWKYLIIAGTAFFAVTAIIVSLMMTKVYSIDMVIEPGIINIIDEGGNKGKRVYIDSSQNLKALIDVGSFNNEILQICKPLGGGKKPLKQIKFKTTIPKKSIALKIAYETPDIEMGTKILQCLNTLLTDKYRKLISYYKKNIDRKIQQSINEVAELKNQLSDIKRTIFSIEIEYGARIKRNKTKIAKINNRIAETRNAIANAKTDTAALVKQKTNKIATIKARKEAKKRQLTSYQKRVLEIQAEIERIKKNTDFLIAERNRLLARKTSEDNAISSIMYMNTIQQNIGYLNSLKTQANNVNNQIFQEKADIERLENEIQDIIVQKENLLLQTDYRTENLKAQINDLESDIKDLEDKNDNLIKDKDFKIDSIKSQINNIESDIKYKEEMLDILRYKKDNVQNIQILKPPTRSPDPVKPKKKLIVVLATMVGAFMMIFIAFFLEYISKNRDREVSKQ